MKTPFSNKKSIILTQLLEFNVVFPNETPLSPAEYLRGGKRSFILQAATFLLGFKSVKSEYEQHETLLGKFFGFENFRFSQEILSKIRDIERTDVKVLIINPLSSLSLFEYFFQNGDEEETQTQSEFERNLFKAYLIFNSRFTKDQTSAFTSTKTLGTDLHFPMMMFCMEYPASDKVNYNINLIWLTQVIKALYLFQFLESSKDAKRLLGAFLLHFNRNTWQDYFNSLLPLTYSLVKDSLESHTDIKVKHDENFENNCSFIERLSIEERDELNEYDFLTLRAKPFYKIEDGTYRVIYKLFVVEKIYKGVYFILREVNNGLPYPAKIPNLKSFLGSEFSERYIFYKTMENITSDHSIHFSGKELEELKIDGAPDYYIRKGKNIQLFESKDFLIRADKKASFDFNVYNEEFKRVLYFEELPDGRKKNKAVMQLINSIRRLLKNEFDPDNKYYYKDIYIFPILITHDHQYDTPGFNYLINHWFQMELENLKREGLFIYHVQPLTVINIDSLIFHQVGLKNKLPLHNVISSYHKFIRIDRRMKFSSDKERNQYLMNRLLPFAQYIENLFIQNNLNELPPILELAKSSLFNKEFGKEVQE